MATTFVGFNTQGQNKKFTLTDQDLIRRDLLNAFNIKQGQLPGRPDYGTIIWSYLFENQTSDTGQAIIQEVQRVCSTDPRIYLNNTEVFTQENGILVQLSVSYVNGVDSEVLSLFFDQQSSQAGLV